MKPSAALLLCCCLVASAAPAAEVDAVHELASRVPAGSIATREDVARARELARATEADAEVTWQSEQARCLRTFFANACLDRARRAWLDARREVRRVRVEAGTIERSLDAKARADARAAADRERPTPEERAAREATARAAYEARQARAHADAADRERHAQEAAARGAAQSQRQQEQLLRETERAAQAESRAQKAREYAERQAQADAYAKQKAQERADNERRRADRQRQREQKMIEQGRVPPVSGDAPASGHADAPRVKVERTGDTPPSDAANEAAPGVVTGKK